MSSPANTPKPTDPFDMLWMQLQECHQKRLQELEEKVCKLKNERRLDAESLQLFYTRNQEMKEQIKTLQDANSLLEDRLQTKECDRCAILEENLKKCQDHSERTLTNLRYERNCLEDENRKLLSELQIIKSSKSQVAHHPGHEDGVIPDSPVLVNSFTVTNKLKKRKYLDNSKHVHDARNSSIKCNRSLFKVQESSDTAKNPKRAQVLVPNTCVMDASQIPGEEEIGGEVIADTCGLELVNTSHMKNTAAGQRYSSKSSLSDICLKPHRISSPSTAIYSPDSTTAKSSFHRPHCEKLNDVDSLVKVKWTKEDDVPKELEEGKTCDSRNGKKLDTKVVLNQTRGVDCGSPAFKKPDVAPKGQAHYKQKKPKFHNVPSKPAHPDDGRNQRVENMWSIDPGLALSMYDIEEDAHEEQPFEELLDTDCTMISHSLLQGRVEEDQHEHGVSGIGDKANDSLDRMFDATAHEEYISYNCTQVGNRPCMEEEEEEEEEEDDEQEAPENSPRVRKMQHPTFAHVAVVRKKDERRKLKGTTCKECEVYYTHLPEEEKQRKLSECSRHRHRFIPPSTPENFWEVGFPSTQTCIERGYIKEEKIPQSRLRRKQPLTALFSPKSCQQKS
ncbi:DNA endonuclease RBBP8 isoform X2 [Syngnathoides biaculeatus]|uniref:DNA endonuclease RBBP8 isoform X2 n=1 Tax=Syngnathoides biaculeatus TaxID=300417 RepID=UPI002ADD8569|nr:DNA endonuclease RBBP8 isoform X2 [Syngnathoides biaculeatus]